MTTRLGFHADEWIAKNPTPANVIPAGRVACDLCDGDGGVPIGDERCPRCHGFGHVANLHDIFQRTAADQLAMSDRASES